MRILVGLLGVTELSRTRSTRRQLEGVVGIGAVRFPRSSARPSDSSTKRHCFPGMNDGEAVAFRVLFVGTAEEVVVD